MTQGKREGPAREAFRRIAVLELSAARLRGEFDVAMFLEDGDGIGWTLVGERRIAGVGRVTFECSWDPEISICSICAPTDSASHALGLVLADLNLGSDSIIQSW